VLHNSHALPVWTVQLIRHANGPEFSLVGLPVSGQSGCGNPNFPGVYMRVAAAEQWILNVTATRVNTPVRLWKGRAGVQQVNLQTVQTNNVTTRVNSSTQSPEMVIQVDPNVNAGAARRRMFLFNQSC
jgi:secreted trypsin-like serine protease